MFNLFHGPTFHIWQMIHFDKLFSMTNILFIWNWYELNELDHICPNLNGDN